MKNGKRDAFTHRRLRLILATGLFSLAGCAVDVQVAGMVVDVARPTLIAERSPLYQAIAVDEVNVPPNRIDLLERPILRADRLTDALRLTLDSHAMLAGGPPRYRLSTNVVGVDGPVFGEFDMRVSITAQYVLRDRRTGRSVFVKRIAAPHTESLLTGFPNVGRIRLAYEGAMRANMAAFMERLVRDVAADRAQLAAVRR